MFFHPDLWCILVCKIFIYTLSLSCFPSLSSSIKNWPHSSRDFQFQSALTCKNLFVSKFSVFNLYPGWRVSCGNIIPSPSADMHRLSECCTQNSKQCRDNKKILHDLKVAITVIFVAMGTWCSCMNKKEQREEVICGWTVFKAGCVCDVKVPYLSLILAQATI